MPVETEIPPELLEPPEGPVPPTPAVTGLQLLPVEQLTPENFERLCLRLARLAGTPERVRRYGTRGQKQYGIDIYSRLPSGRYVTYQCKRYQELEPGNLSDAVDRFLDGKWAERSERFVFCTSSSVDRTQVEEEIEKQSDRLAQSDPPIAFEVLDVEELSQQLRDHEDIVRLAR